MAPLAARRPTTCLRPSDVTPRPRPRLAWFLGHHVAVCFQLDLQFPVPLLQRDQWQSRPPRWTKNVNSGAAIAANTRTGGEQRLSIQRVGASAWAGSVVVDTTNGTQISVISYTAFAPATASPVQRRLPTPLTAARKAPPTIYQRNTDNVCRAPTILTMIGSSTDPVRIRTRPTTLLTDVDIYFYNLDGSTAYQELNPVHPGWKSLNPQHPCQYGSINLGGNWTGASTSIRTLTWWAVSVPLVGGSDMSAYKRLQHQPLVVLPV